MTNVSRTALGLNPPSLLPPRRGGFGLGVPAGPATSPETLGVGAPSPADAPSRLRAALTTQMRFATFVQAARPTASGVDTHALGAPSDHVAASGNDTPSGMADLLARLPEDVRAEVERFVNGEVAADYYTPESTADRIVSFVLGGFDRFEGGAAAQENTSETRQRFVDFILPAIDKGYGEALDQLGELPDEVLSSLEKTRTLIGERLDGFATQESVSVDA